MTGTITRVKSLASAVLAALAIVGGITSLTTAPGVHRHERPTRCAVDHRPCEANGQTRDGTSAPGDAVVEAGVAIGQTGDGCALHPAAAEPGTFTTLTCDGRPPSAVALKRPHDPPHLHAFSLLI